MGAKNFRKKTAPLAMLAVLAACCAALAPACRWGGAAPADNGGGNGAGAQQKGFGWDAGKLGGLTETITGDLTAAEYFFNKGLTAGWNLGNALDSSAASETAWGNPAITQDIFNGVKGAGFNVVRIPVTWGNNTGTYTARLDRVAEAAAMAHKAGLVTIINVHHDASPETPSVGPWLLLTNAGQSAQNKTAITAQYKTLWTQIANKFKGHGEWLIFESINEPKSTGNDYWESANPGEADAYEIINEWNKAFTDVVRASGGNNAKRMLMYNAYAAKPGRATDPSFKLPDDSAKDRQIVSFHYYLPQAFSLEGTRTFYDPEYDSMDNNLEKIRGHFGGKIPIVIGECGATYQGAREGAEKTEADKSRIAYYAHLGAQAKKNGMVPVLWDNGSNRAVNKENFGLFNRATGSLLNNSANCVNALIQAAKR